MAYHHRLLLFRRMLCALTTSTKQQWDEAKKKKKAAKIDPINVTKDITIFSSIGEHDLVVKMSHLREFLERGNSARVSNIVGE